MIYPSIDPRLGDWSFEEIIKHVYPDQQIRYEFIDRQCSLLTESGVELWLEDGDEKFKAAKRQYIDKNKGLKKEIEAMCDETAKYRQAVMQTDVDVYNWRQSFELAHPSSKPPVVATELFEHDWGEPPNNPPPSSEIIDDTPLDDKSPEAETKPTPPENKPTSPDGKPSAPDGKPQVKGWSKGSKIAAGIVAALALGSAGIWYFKSKKEKTKQETNLNTVV